MRFLILGCNGMAGHMVSLYLKEKGHQVTGFAREDAGIVDTVTGDARNLELIRKTVEEGKFDAVVNCIGLLNQFAEKDHEAAVFLNAYLPQYLAFLTQDMATQVIHMSTDCVFSGSKGRYTEHDLPDGSSFYDRSKALGELNDQKNITFRNSIVGPDRNASGIGLLNWFMKQKGSVKGYRNAVWTGQTSLQLAKTIESAAFLQIHGLYHMVPDSSISKYDMLVLFNKYLRREPAEIIAEDNFKIDKSLIRTEDGGFCCKIPDYEMQVEELGVWMREHRQLYPHYDLADI